MSSTSPQKRISNGLSTRVNTRSQTQGPTPTPSPPSPKPHLTTGNQHHSSSPPSKTTEEAKAFLLKHALIIPDTPLTMLELTSTILHISQLARVPKTVADALTAVVTLLRHAEIDTLKQHLIDVVSEGLVAKIELHLTQFDLTHDILDANTTSLHSAIDDLEKIKTEQTSLLIQQHNAFQQSLANLETTMAKV